MRGTPAGARRACRQVLFAVNEGEELLAGMDAQLRVDVLGVGAHGALADEELFGDVDGRVPAPQVGQDLNLALGKLGGLSFATIVLLLGLFGMGDLNWGIIFAPAVLILELVVLKKWCTRWCPLWALFNLVGRFSKTGMPEIDNAKCLETSKGVACSKCASVCKYDVNLRHPEFGERGLADCSRCMDCVKACPANAIHIAVVNKKKPSEFVMQLPASEVEALAKGE